MASGGQAGAPKAAIRIGDYKLMSWCYEVAGVGMTNALSLVLPCLAARLRALLSCLVLSCSLSCLVLQLVLSCLVLQLVLSCLVLSCRRRRYDKRARTFVVFALCYAAGGNITRPVACPDPELCDPEFLKGPVLYNLKVSKSGTFFCVCGGGGVFIDKM